MLQGLYICIHYIKYIPTTLDRVYVRFYLVNFPQ